MTIEIKKIEHDFSICKVTEIPDSALKEEFCFIGKTDEELSVVCLTEKVPENSSTGEIFKELLADDYSFDERIEKGESALTILDNTLRYVEDELMHDENSMSLAIYEFANIGENHGYFPTVETRARDRWTRLIEYGMRTGEFMKVDARAVAEMILYYYQGLRMWSRVIRIDEKYALHYKKTILLTLTGKRFGE